MEQDARLPNCHNMADYPTPVANAIAIAIAITVAAVARCKCHKPLQVAKPLSATQQKFSLNWQLQSSTTLPLPPLPPFSHFPSRLFCLPPLALALHLLLTWQLALNFLPFVIATPWKIGSPANTQLQGHRRSKWRLWQRQLKLCAFLAQLCRIVSLAWGLWLIS